MKITDDELLSIIEDVTLTLGQILLNHRELSESLFEVDPESWTAGTVLINQIGTVQHVQETTPA
jgi:hypothetical protein